MTRDLIDYDICKTQEDIFEYAIKQGYELQSFAEEYLTSDFCRREFDTPYSSFQVADAEESADFFMPEIGSRLVKSTKHGEYDAFAGDIGFMYRLLYIKTSVPSAELIKIIPFETMANQSFTFDHYGFDVIADEFIEEYNLPLKRYDSEVPYLSDEDYERMKSEAMQEALLARPVDEEQNDD